jgi:hypothetical protein
MVMAPARMPTPGDLPYAILRTTTPLWRLTQGGEADAPSFMPQDDRRISLVQVSVVRSGSTEKIFDRPFMCRYISRV